MTTTMDSDPPLCTVCDAEERPGVLHGPGGTRQHPFTPPGEPDWVPPKDKPKKGDQNKAPVGRPQQMVILPQPDLALRSLLVAKGLITDKELKEAEDALRFPGGADPVPTDRSHPE